MASGSDDDIDKRFSEATLYVQANAHSFEQNQLLGFYGFYKQSTVGKCNTQKPSWYEMEAKAKWNAWNKLGDLPRSIAETEYVKLLSELRPDWESGDSSSSKDRSRWVSVSCMAQEDDAIDKNDKTSFDWVKEGDIEMIRSTVDRLSIDDLDEEGMGLIHWAADRGNPTIVGILLDSSADIDLLDSTGQTALHYASACGHSDAVKLLLERGASTHIKCSEGLTPADVAMTEDICTIINQST